MIPENEYINVGLEELKIFFSKKEVLYRLLEGPHYNLVLPNIHSSAITVEYILNVASKAVYTIPKDKYKKAPDTKDKSLTIYDLIEILTTIVKQPLGFDNNHFPNKKWLIDCIYSESKNNSIFIDDSKTFYRAIPKEFFKKNFYNNEARRNLSKI